MMEEPSLAKASQHWDVEFQGAASAESRGATYALASPLFQAEYLNPHWSKPGADWVEWLVDKVAKHGPLERALVLGCGLGDGLPDFYRRGLAKQLHGIDASPVAIELAKTQVEELGLGDSISFAVGDFHQSEVPDGHYDIVLFVMSLHHAFHSVRVLACAKRALKPGGWLLANEYIGPNRWQYTWPQLLLIKAFLTVMPRSLRRTESGVVKGRIGRPTLQWMMDNDPSEAADSEVIPRALEEAFSIHERHDYGCAITLPVLDGIIQNFGHANPQSMRWLRWITSVEKLASGIGLIPQANALFLARKPSDLEG